jgi:oligoendopeptidase F
MNSLKQSRFFLPGELEIQSWKDIEPYFRLLQDAEINTVEALRLWLRQVSELDAMLEEELAWRYIRMSCDTTQPELSEHFRIFVSEIEPEVNRFTNLLDIKLMESPAIHDLKGIAYEILFRSTKTQLELFRDENIPLIAQLQEMEQEYGSISSLMMIHYNDQELTLQQASNFLKDPNREVREEVFKLMTTRRLQDSVALDELLSSLIKIRHQVALNAGFSNYRDFKFAALERFDYTPHDVQVFRQSIADVVKPLVEKIHQIRKKKLSLTKLQPFDLQVDTNLLPPLKPFDSPNELLIKSIQAFSAIHPFFGQCLQIMRDGNFLDLESRKGKAPGGFNYPLYESNIPFIYMNATGNLRDLVTLMHEGGHAVHSFLSAPLELVDFKSTPSEVAELASMSMELISMDQWNLFFNSDDLVRAKNTQLEGLLEVFTWVAQVDHFQEWLYLNPTHSIEERKMAWLNFSSIYGSSIVDWTDYPESAAYKWQTQLHIFEVPFYYIEYAMAQLGAIAIWKNYMQNPHETLEAYQAALRLGYTQPIPEIYKTAGIRFDFSRDYLNEIMQIVKEQLQLDVKNDE